MRSRRWTVGILLVLLCQLCNAADLSNYSAAVAYVRSLATMHDLQVDGKMEFSNSRSSTSQLMTSVRMSTKANLEMRAMIAGFEQLEVSDHAKPFVRGLADFYQQKIELNDALKEIASQMLGGPKPGVDYGKLMASSAEITATMDQIDEQIFKLANAFFAVMIDMRPDKEGHVSHLKITRAQRKELLGLIESRFGASLKDKARNWTVSGAWLMRANLQKEFKTSDEAW